jgi:hypothetical protein
MSDRTAELRRVAAIALGVGVVIVLLVAVIYWLPPRLTRTNVRLKPAARLKAESDVRGTLVQVLAGIFVAAGLVFTARTYELNRQGHITERFTNAIDQLGSESLEVRLGGIYALGRIARNSREDHLPIIEILSAFLREQSKTTLVTPITPTDDHPAIVGPKLRADLQAAITVIGRRNRRNEPNEYEVWLREVDLRKADLRELHLEHAELIDAHLEGAWLHEAHLEHATLIRAHLDGALCIGTRFDEALLAEATLTDASLSGADLTEASGFTYGQLASCSLAFGAKLPFVFVPLGIDLDALTQVLTESEFKERYRGSEGTPTAT